MAQEQTVMASEIVKRLNELIAAHGDKPIWFMEPMSGAALPMRPREIDNKNDRIELWPKT